MLVYGGRTYDNKTRLFAELDAIHRVTPVTVVIHGDARGADRLGKFWAQQNGIKDEPYPADWDDLQAENVKAIRREDGSFYNSAAGATRNALMMRKGKPDIAVEFAGGKGTANMRGLVKAEMKVRPLHYIKVRQEEWTLVRVVGPFVAGFETDGKTVRRAAPILRHLVGKTEDEARAWIKERGYKASVVLTALGNGQPE
jgi:hypothetical protein